MTAQPINLQQLRERANTPIDSGRFATHGKVLIEPNELLALIDTVEAAHRLAATNADQQLPFGVMDSADAHKEFDESFDQLRQALTSFTFQQPTP